MHRTTRISYHCELDFSKLCTTIWTNDFAPSPEASYQMLVSLTDVPGRRIDPLQRALYGDKQIASLCKQFAVPSPEAAQIVIEYSLYKQGQHMGAHLATLEQA